MFPVLQLPAFGFQLEEFRYVWKIQRGLPLGNQQMFKHPRLFISGAGFEHKRTELVEVFWLVCPISDGQFNMNSGIRQRLFQLAILLKSRLEAEIDVDPT